MSEHMQSIARNRIIEAARGWVGTPFRHQGRKKGVGVDCIGLVCGVGAELGVRAEIPGNYSQSPSGDLVISGCDKYLVKPEDQATPLPGQVMILWGFDRNTPQHFAILGGDPWKITMVHAFSRRGAVIEDVYDHFWSKRFVALYEFPGTEPWSA